MSFKNTRFDATTAKTLYIYLDESGNFDFGAKGTKYFVLCAVATLQPLDSKNSLQSLKYDCLAQGYNIECFHASEDRQWLRDEVFKRIREHQNISFNFVATNKHKINVSMQSFSRFYALLGGVLLKHCFEQYQSSQIDQVVVIFDRALSARQQESFDGFIKPTLKQLNKHFNIYFHSTKADFNSQIADYGAWSLYVKLSRDESRPFRELSIFEPTVLNIL